MEWTTLSDCGTLRTSPQQEIEKELITALTDGIRATIATRSSHETYLIMIAPDATSAPRRIKVSQVVLCAL